MNTGNIWMRSEADTRRSNNFRVGKARGEASGRNVLWLRFPRFAQSKCRCENRSCHFARPVLQMSLRESFLPPLPPRTSNVAARIVPAASPAPYFKCRCENRSCRLARPVLQMSLRGSLEEFLQSLLVGCRFCAVTFDVRRTLDEQHVLIL